MKERIEIKPGVFILVTRRLRQHVGLRQSQRISPASLDSAVRDINRARRGNVKYSTLLLTEAVELSKVIGEIKAAKKTGVGLWSLKGRKREMIRAGTYQPKVRGGGHPRYTLVQKQACVRLAQELMATGGTREVSRMFRGKMRTFRVRKWGRKAAFVEAGRRLGVNGSSIEWMWTSGQFFEPSTAQPPPASPGSG